MILLHSINAAHHYSPILCHHSPTLYLFVFYRSFPALISHKPIGFSTFISNETDGFIRPVFCDLPAIFHPSFRMCPETFSTLISRMVDNCFQSSFRIPPIFHTPFSSQSRPLFSSFFFWFFRIASILSGSHRFDVSQCVSKVTAAAKIGTEKQNRPSAPTPFRYGFGYLADFVSEIYSAR